MKIRLDGVVSCPSRLTSKATTREKIDANVLIVTAIVPLQCRNENINVVVGYLNLPALTILIDL